MEPTHSTVAKRRKRDNHGHFVDESTVAQPVITQTTYKASKDEYPPLITITNPITYLKLWWKKVMGQEGVDVKFRIHPITAIAFALILVAGGASAGWIIKTAQYNASKLPFLTAFIPTPSPTPDPWRDTAYTGILRKVSVGKYYLQTGDGQAVTLSIPTNVNLEKYIGKKIFASGRYNMFEQILYVSDATDLEYVVQSVPIPTTSPTPSPSNPPIPSL